MLAKALPVTSRTVSIRYTHRDPVAAQDVTLALAAFLRGQHQPIDHIPHIHEIVCAFDVEHRFRLGCATDDFAHFGAAEIVWADHAGRADDDCIQPFRRGFLDLQAGFRFRAVIRPVRVIQFKRLGLIDDLAVRDAPDGMDRTGIDQPLNAGVSWLPARILRVPSTLTRRTMDFHPA